MSTTPRRMQRHQLPVGAAEVCSEGGLQDRVGSEGLEGFLQAAGQGLGRAGCRGVGVGVGITAGAGIEPALDAIEAGGQHRRLQ
jgi:hypothetical protein